MIQVLHVVLGLNLRFGNIHVDLHNPRTRDCIHMQVLKRVDALKKKNNTYKEPHFKSLDSIGRIPKI